MCSAPSAGVIWLGVPVEGAEMPDDLSGHLETNLASRWKGVRLPRASGKSPDFPEVPQTSLEVFRRLPRKFSHCGT